MTQRSWTTSEVKILRDFASLGSLGVAELLDRSKTSVEAKAKTCGISLIASGDDIAISKEVEAIVKRLNLYLRLSICPACGIRVAIVKKSGTCRVCYLDALITIREEQILELARERKLTKLRQDKRRLRVCYRCNDPFFPRAEASKELCSKCEGYR